jgi:hypothetical protein
LLPDSEWGLILASNYQHTPIGQLRDGVLDILLGHDPEEKRAWNFFYPNPVKAVGA